MPRRRPDFSFSARTCVAAAAVLLPAAMATARPTGVASSGSAHINNVLRLSGTLDYRDDRSDFFIGGGGNWQNESELAGAGEIGVNRMNGRFDIASRVSETWMVGFSTSYEYSIYDFDGPSFFGGEPFEEIHRVAAALTFTLQPDDEWTVFFGPVFEAAAEMPGEFDNGIRGGGMAGAVYRASDELILGLGLGLSSEIEDDTDYFYVLVFDWEITDQLSISTLRAPMATGKAGIEVVYRVKDEVELAAGFRDADSYRFRLDDDGIAPNGIGEDEFEELYFRTTWRPSADFELTGILGVALDPRIRLEDRDGDFLTEVRYNDAFSLQLQASLRF